MIEEIYNFLPLTENLLSSGMPTAGQVSDIAAAGVQVVINLALPASERALADEDKLVESLGMTYINIPVEWERPAGQNLDDFMKVMKAHEESKILVHCQANYRATGFYHSLPRPAPGLAKGESPPGFAPHLESSRIPGLE